MAELLGWLESDSSSALCDGQFIIINGKHPARCRDSSQRICRVCGWGFVELYLSVISQPWGQQHDEGHCQFVYVLPCRRHRAGSVTLCRCVVKKLHLPQLGVSHGRTVEWLVLRRHAHILYGVLIAVCRPCLDPTVPCSDPTVASPAHVVDACEALDWFFSSK